jgi:hypothetical protein
VIRPWRVAGSLLVLRGEIDRRWPERDKTSDGTIGDAAHATHESDHNPFIVDDEGIGVVRALDVDVDGINAAQLAEHLRQLGKKGDERLNGKGYVIFNRRIASEVQDWTWRQYNGENPHTSHVHVSVSRTADPGYDSLGGWGVLDPLEGYTENEKLWIREYDRLVREHRDLPLRRALRKSMTKQRKRIWRSAQPASEGGDGKGWDHARRRDRYRSLRARTS